MTKELYCVAKGLCYDAKGLYCRTLISVAKFPASSRDLAFLAPVDTSNQAILDIIREKGGDYLEAVHLFDLYQGKQVPRGYKSLAYNLVFRSEQGTLTDQDIQAPIDAILTDLKEKLNCELR